MSGVIVRDLERRLVRSWSEQLSWTAVRQHIMLSKRVVKAAARVEAHAVDCLVSDSAGYDHHVVATVDR
jgi:hypothetical protein